MFHAATEYFLLAIFILMGNTFVLELVVNYFNVNHLSAKIVTEVVFFVISWLVQKRYVFSK